MYSDDQSDMDFQSVVPIGTAGLPSMLIDHRGFLPLSVPSKSKQKGQTSGLSGFFRNLDIYQWYAVEPLFGACIVKFGLGREVAPQEVERFEDQIEYVPESEVEISRKPWISFIHRAFAEKGEQFYKLAGGGAGFESAEPVMTLIIGNRLVLVVSFRYRGVSRHGTGQILCAYEYVDELFTLTTFYALYSTQPINMRPVSQVGEIARIAAPYVAKFLS